MTLNDILFPIAILLANIIQGITGFAGSLLAMPPVIHLQGLDTARVTVNFYGLLSCTWIFMQSYKQINWKEAIKMTVGMLTGLVIGIYVFSVFQVSILLTIYSVFVIGIALKGLFIKTETKIPEVILIILVVIAGIFQGLFVSGGPLLVIYAATKLKDKTLVRGTMSIVWIILNASLAIQQAVAGQFTPEVIKVTLLGIPAMYLGIWLGTKVFQKLSGDKFMTLVYVLVILSGASLLMTSLA